MKRRESLKTLALSGLGAGLLLESCKTDEKAAVTPGDAAKGKEATYDRFPEEAAHDKKLLAETFFTAAEMTVIAILADIIIPADEVSGSATEAGVPDFIEFMAKDKPELQLPLRGGMQWLDMQSLKRFETGFAASTTAQQMEIIDEIAWPNKAKPEMQQGVAFFNLMRNLTASGFYTSKIGMADMGYMGNKPNQWNGVPDDVLKQYGLRYTEKELMECVKFD